MNRTTKILLKTILTAITICTILYLVQIKLMFNQWDKNEELTVTKSIEQLKQEKFKIKVLSNTDEIENFAQFIIERREHIAKNLTSYPSKIIATDDLIAKLSQYENYMNLLENITYIQLCEQNKNGVIFFMGEEKTQWSQVNHKLYFNCPNLTSHVLETTSDRLAKDTTLNLNLKYAIEIIPHTL